MINCTFEGQTDIVHLRHVVVDALVIKEKQILLVKRGGPQWFLEVDKWALPGGFVEMNETCAAAAVREVREETGYEAKVIKLFQVNDNPHRPHELNRQNVSLIYLMKPLEKVSNHDDEINEVKWFYLDNLPSAKEMAFDHLETIKMYISKQ